MAKLIPCQVCGLAIMIPNIDPQDLVGVIHCPRCLRDPIPYVDEDDWDISNDVEEAEEGPDDDEEEDE